MLELVNVSYYKAPNRVKINPHVIRKGFEYIEILTGGKLLFELDGKEQVFEYGTMFWHIPGDHTIHEYLPDFPYECLCLRFKRPERKSGRCFPRVAVWEDREESLSFSDKVIKAFLDDSFDRKLIAEYVFSKVAWEAASFLKRKPSPDIPLSLARLLAFIENNYHGDLAIGDLANASGVSIPHLHSLSSKFLKTSPHVILLNKRLQEARRLLATTGNEVKTIGSDCGFMNVETFCRAFRRKYQTSPGEFRKSNSPKHILKDV
ncbi:MAG: AraC family transcriptional regulator [Victivallales bacterium]